MVGDSVNDMADAQAVGPTLTDIHTVADDWRDYTSLGDEDAMDVRALELLHYGLPFLMYEGLMQSEAFTTALDEGWMPLRPGKGVPAGFEGYAIILENTDHDVLRFVRPAHYMEYTGEGEWVV